MNVIKVYAAGEKSTPSPPFSIALANFKKALSKRNLQVTVETKRISDFASKKYSSDQTLSWLESGWMSFIHCHPLQADFPPADWNYSEFLADLKHRLCDKQIFPPMHHKGEDVYLDPAFSQDKFRYLDKCKDICNPSYKIICDWKYDRDMDCELPELSAATKLDMLRFCRANYEVDKDCECLGWVIKAPFTTGLFI